VPAVLADDGYVVSAEELSRPWIGVSRGLLFTS
jgi:hypothetical protein